MKLCEWVGGWCARARARKLEGLLKNPIHRLMLYCHSKCNKLHTRTLNLLLEGRGRRKEGKRLPYFKDGSV